MAGDEEHLIVRPTTALRHRIVRGLLFLASLAAATTLVLLVAAGSSAPRVDLGASSGGAALLLDLLTALVVAGSLMGLVLLISSLRMRKAEPIHVERKRGTFSMLVTLVAVLLLVRLLPDPAPRSAQGPEVGSAEPGLSVDEAAVEVDRSLVVTALTAALVLAGLAALSRRELARRDGDVRVQAAFEEPRVRQVLRDVLADLAEIADPREAVLHAYERLRGDLDEAGLAQRTDDTPRRVVVRAVEHLGVPHDAIDRLVAVFELARFSSRPFHASLRDDAMRALDDIERSLGLAEAQ